ncbi:MAG: tyrosine-type recombinase/integrase [Oscillospiraceae bacterium]|nr:tyrosine-type recombinase/integrase [Oscillospiraceae bacterium]
MKTSYWDECPPVLRSYLGYAQTVKGRSEKTVNEYFKDLRTFFRFLKQRRGLLSDSGAAIAIDDIDIAFIRSITMMDVYEFLNHQKGDLANDNRTLARKIVSLRMFFRYLTNHTHELDKNPIQNLDMPKGKKTLPKYLTLEQSLQLLSLPDGLFAERDFCMLTLLLNCGLRRAEVAGLNLHDIRPDHTLLVRGKGNKERILYLNDACQRAIEAYLPHRPVDGVRDREALFLNHLRTRITVDGVYYVVKKYLGHVEGAEDYSTHKLRHTAATLMYQHGGVDIRVLKDILGHENLGTTEIYTHLSDEQIKHAAEANPLSKVERKIKKVEKKEKSEDNG